MTFTDPASGDEIEAAPIAALMDFTRGLPNRERVLAPSGGCETFGRSSVSTLNLTAWLGGTGQPSLAAIALPKGFVVTNVGFLSGSTPAGTPTHWWYSLCDNTYTTLRSTADQTTTPWAANTLKTLALATPFTTLYAGLYYLSLGVVATTVPTLTGVQSSTAMTGLTPITSFKGNTGVTSVPSDGTLLSSSPTAVSQTPWAYAA